MARPAPQPAPEIRVLIAEDHAVVREGIRMILDAQPDLEVVGEARDGDEAVRLARQLRPDVVVMDISMPKKNGVEATQEIRRVLPETQVLILTMHEEESYVFQLLRLGAAGYVLKRAAATDLVEAVRAAARGEAFLYPAVARSVVQDYLDRMRSGEGAGRYDGLTDREREILVLIAEGLTNAQIADRLFISVKTVQTHRAHIMEKLDLHDRSLLVRYAVRKGLIQP
ncbi:MAG: response regulator transcription factor [Armatimonadota bacterium]|nr:response regulator transcription factor [Armatimonadota bacterium]MDR7451433.1 response regulator transcription factor [Armatimonadota bacterium]MDR7466417.1 response regulator transcription factor [Armatimonadota bacterium]MDR7493139.1 response regulator transcription factor [Armatimonadota bacterium]MDR7498104.1 response regulator transcription factor [Armatimonadota bacterium]